MLRCRVVPHQLKRDRRRIPCQLKSCAVFLFLEHYNHTMTSFSSIEERSTREEPGCFDARWWEKQNWRGTVEKGGTTRESHRRRRRLQREEELGCFYASLVVANLEFHVDLVLREKSLRCFIFAICVNNVSYERYVIFIT